MKVILFLSTFIKTRYFPLKSRKAIEAYQKRELKKQLAYFKEHAPLFKEGVDLDHFQMDKAFMMAHFDQLNTQGIHKEEALAVAIEAEQTRDFSPKIGQISVGLSSGTSGHRGIFLTSPREQVMWAAAILAKLLPKGKLWRHRIAFFLRANNNLYEGVHSPFITFRFFDMERDIASYIEDLNHYQPSLLIGPASVLRRLASYQNEGSLHLQPKRVYSVAEVLEDGDASYIAQAFGQDFVAQVYQATEGFLAATCEHGQLHLNEDIVQVQPDWIDDKRFYPIITDLKRRSQAFLQYRLNDILQYKDQPCPCGSAYQVLEKIEGRSDDIFLFENAQGQEVAIYPDFIRRAVLFVEGIDEYQVIQRGPDQLQVALLGAREEEVQAVIKELSNLLADHAIEGVDVQSIPYAPDKKVKLKRIIKKG